MRRRSLLSLALVLALTAVAAAADVNGTWQGAVQTPDGDLMITFTFKADGEVLTGSVASPMGEVPLKNGKVSGDVLTFDVEIETMVVSHEATVNGDEITVTARGDWGESQYIVKRVKP